MFIQAQAQDDFCQNIFWEFMSSFGQIINFIRPQTVCLWPQGEREQVTLVQRFDNLLSHHQYGNDKQTSSVVSYKPTWLSKLFLKCHQKWLSTLKYSGEMSGNSFECQLSGLAAYVKGSCFFVTCVSKERIEGPWDSQGFKVRHEIKFQT